MRRQVVSESEINTTVKPVAAARSISLNTESERSDMQLIMQDGLVHTETTTCAKINCAKSINSKDTDSNFLHSGLKDVSAENSVTDAMTAYNSSSGRPTSLSSVASSRTSRSSDYFSSASASESHQQLVSDCSGTQFDFSVESTEADSAAIRPTLNKVVESVQEEEEAEEGFVDDDNVDPLKENQSKHFNNSSNKLERGKFRDHALQIDSENGISVKDINKKLSEVDHLSPIATMAMVANPKLTYVDRIILELLETEMMYVRALEDILGGYVLGLRNKSSEFQLSPNDLQILFGNIKDIYAFNRKFLSSLQNCENDPVKIARNFVSQDTSFSVYTEYCTNYPVSVAVLTRCLKNPSLGQFFKKQQENLAHNLPLGSYLLKPVQRILKYHLILQELVKNCDKNKEGYSTIEKALQTMTNIARHINEMKRKHEDAVHIQEIQSLLTNWQGDDLSTYGGIVLEGELKLQGAKNGRLLFLFDRMILITKRREDGFLVCKTHIMCSDLTMLESVKDNPLSFLISQFDSPSIHSNNHGSRVNKEWIFTAKYMDEKKLWTHNIKNLMLQNHHTEIPAQARQSIMNMPDAGIDDGLLDDHKRSSMRRYGSGIPSSNIIVNGKPRRRSDSTSRKGLALRPWKKHETELSDDVSSDSVPSTPTIVFGKPRFSFPRLIRSNSPKQETGEEAAPAAVEKADEKKNPKDKKNEAKRSEKYKESVIYRRHKRRTSQPITDFEKRLSVRAPSEGEENIDKKPNEVSLEDFESLEDFLNFNVESKRESLSWDLQIVEPFFEKLKLEKEKKAAERREEEERSQSTNLIPLPKQVPSRVPSALSTDDMPPSLPLKLSPKVEKPLSTICGCEKPKPEDFRLPEKDEKLQKEIACTKPNNTTVEKLNPNLTNDNVINDVTNEPISVASAEKKAILADGADPISNVPKLKRSLSTQTSNQDRKRYFDRLKELRDRRHSQRSLGADAKTIQSGKVQEMIQQHREQMLASQDNPNCPDLGKQSERLYKRRSEPCTRVSHRNSRCGSQQKKDEHNSISSSSVEMREQRDQNCETDLKNGSKLEDCFSLEVEKTEENRLSTVTMGSLPLFFTSSSSSCSSEGANEEPSCSSPPNSKFMSHLQPQIFLWRSYSEDTGSSTRRSRNLVLEASSLEHAVCQTPDRKSPCTHKTDKFNFNEMGKIVQGTDTDKMSEEVDCVWDDLEITDEDQRKAETSNRRQTRQRHKSPDFRPTPIKSNSLTLSKGSENPSIQVESTSDRSPAKHSHDTKLKTAQQESKSSQQTCKPANSVRRTGRMRERGSSSECKPNVRKLAQQFNQMSETTTSHRRTYGRSQSAGPRKHISDLRLSSTTESPSTTKINYDDIKKQLKKNSQRSNSLVSSSNSILSPRPCFTREPEAPKSPEQEKLEANPLKSSRELPHSSIVTSLGSISIASFLGPRKEFSSRDNVSPKSDRPPSFAAGEDEHCQAAPTPSINRPIPSDFISRFCKT